MTLKQYIVLAVCLIFAFVVHAQNYSNIEFIENKGQWDSRIRYLGEVYAGAFYIRSGGFSVLQHNRQDFDKVQSSFHDHEATIARVKKNDPLVLRSHVYAVDFVGAEEQVQLVPDKDAGYYNNYFLGSDQSRWATNCRVYLGITMKNVYPNVDVRYYTDNGSLKYDIIARPGADVSRIALRYQGAEKLQVQNKELVVSTSVGDLKETVPYSYVADGKERRTVTANYVVKDNIVRFNVKNYDRSATLVIDPNLIFCSLSGSTASNWGYTATYGPDGSFYGGGIVFSGGTFNVSPGAFQTSFQGGNSTGTPPIDIGIIRLSPNGSTRLYGTYIGGTNGNEQPHSLVVDGAGNLILAGRTNSTDFPTIGPAVGPGGGFDIIVTMLNSTGSALLGSKRIGGSGDDGVNINASRSGSSSLQRNYGDDGRSEVILDGGGNVYVASSTRSTNFPTTPGSFQPNPGGGSQDGVVLKLTPNLSGVLFASYLGGEGNDAAYVLSLSPATGEIFVAGGTESLNFVGNHAGTLGPANHASAGSSPIDGYVAQISNDGSTIIRSTYIGTNGADQVYGIQFDRNAFPYVMGQTTGAWPVTPGTPTFGSASAKQFIAKLQPDLSAYVYSTVFGTTSAVPNISPTAFLVDRCENVYVSGWGGDNLSGAYPTAGTTGMPVTADALKPTTDGKDFYFFVLQKDAVAQLYGSFFGQNGGPFGDHVDGGTSRFDANGVIYQGVCANCGGGATFPVTPGVAGPVNGALPNGCNLGMIKIAFNLAGVGADLQSAIGGVPNDTAGCLPLTVVFTDLVRNATQYIWNFGDGTGNFGPMSADTGYTRSHTFTSVGTYRVMLIAIDPASCNLRDTAYIHIRVGDLEARLAQRITKQNPCDSFKYLFENLTPPDPRRAFTDSSFKWVFGDGSAPVIAGLNPVTHIYPQPGDYDGWLVLLDTAFCNFPDSIPFRVSVAANVVAEFSTPGVGCAPYDAPFINSSQGGETYLWDFGDPASGANNTSTEFEPTHTYAVPGNYTITLVTTNPNTCNVSDTARFTLTVYEGPTAAFSYSPTVPVENTDHIFTNLSSTNANRFVWHFGDGDTLATTSRADVVHQYNSTGTFTACLYAFNSIGCYDSACQQVRTIVVPALDVPNAFTPNQPGPNGVIYVRGYGIAKMRFIIWNRWGQKVFETNNRLQGWNGRVNGVVQPMDVYAYTLDVEFFDGTKATKTGDITLIR